jgi:hypothetical protein
MIVHRHQHPGVSFFVSHHESESTMAEKKPVFVSKLKNGILPAVRKKSYFN